MDSRTAVEWAGQGVGKEAGVYVEVPPRVWVTSGTTCPV